MNSRTTPESVAAVREFIPTWSPPPDGWCDNCAEDYSTRTADPDWPLAFGFVEPMELCGRCWSMIAGRIAA